MFGEALAEANRILEEALKLGREISGSGNGQPTHRQKIKWTVKTKSDAKMLENRLKKVSERIDTLIATETM